METLKDLEESMSHLTVQRKYAQQDLNEIDADIRRIRDKMAKIICPLELGEMVEVRGQRSMVVEIRRPKYRNGPGMWLAICENGSCLAGDGDKQTMKVVA